MADIELATAYISLVAETRGLSRDIQRELGRVGDRAGREAGDDFSSSFTRNARSARADVRGAADGAGRAGSAAGGDFASGFGRSASSGIEGSLDDAMSNAGGGRGGGAGMDMAGGFLEGFGGKIGMLGAAGGPIGMALTAAAGLGLAAGGLLAKGVMDGFGQMQSRDLIQARLGINDAAMQTIGTAAGGAFSNAWGESVQANMETAQMAIQGGILNGEETAAGMQPVIENLNVVNDLIGGDMATTVRATGSLMKNGLAADAEGAFDLITKAYQRGGGVADDLIDSVMEYGNGWKQTGFSGEFSMGLITQAMANGVDNTDRAADAIREFGRRMYEESDTIAGAIGDLGLPVDDLMGKLKSGGPEAEAAFDQIFDAIRQIEDPAKRAATAQALLGDTAGDFINAFTNWDPSTASKSFGTVAGAAQQAADTMSSNPMAKWESAMNTISVQADELKLSLAEAFAPMAEKLGAWVAEHKPEIIGFFTDLGSGMLTLLDYGAAATSGLLRMWGNTSGYLMDMIGGMISAFGSFGETVGGIVKYIPGMEGVGEAIEGGGRAAQAFGDKVGGMREGALALADTIDGTVRPGLQGARDDLRNAGDQAANSAALMRDLGGSVTAIPGSKDITIADNSPETIARLESLGLKVIRTPSGIRVTATTDEAQGTIDALLNQKRTMWVDVKTRLDRGEIDFGQAYSLTTGGTPRQNAKGGYISGPGTGTSDSILSWLSNGEFVEPAHAVTPETLPLLEAIRGGWVPPASLLHDMLPGFASGGMVGFNRDAAVGKAQSHNGEPYVYGELDCSGYLSEVFNAGTGESVRFVTGSDFAGMGWAPGYDPNGFSIGTDGGVGENGHMAGTLYGVNIESDGSNGIQYGGSADGAQDFPMVWHWPGASGGDDPASESLSGLTAQSAPGIGIGAGGGITGGGSGTSGTSGGTGASSAGSASAAVSVFVTNWPGSFTPATPGSPMGATTPAVDATPATELDPNAFDPQKRAAEFGNQVGDIGTNAALDILGISKPGGFIGALLSPEVAEAARQTVGGITAGAQSWRPGVQIDNHVTVSSDQEQLRKLLEMNKRLLMQYGGAMP
ncbi:phage tail tape measure protein [Rhodococcus sp. NPDC058532]|uniref:phage tail tape measure protein n=1 Tax=Rhodococcus sp. NPDC058532 TaxID=3346540 RepID=UPI00365405E0